MLTVRRGPNGSLFTRRLVLNDRRSDLPQVEKAPRLAEITKPLMRPLRKEYHGQDCPGQEDR